MSNHSNVRTLKPRIDGVGSHIKTLYDKKYGIQWAIAKPGAPTRITREFLDDLIDTQNKIRHRIDVEGDVRFQVFTTAKTGIFSLGGDLGFFARCAETQDRQALEKYASDATEYVYRNATGHNHAVTTISVVKGAAFGGGFEGALAANQIIAERQSLFSFPETRFGMYPGMGAFTLLRRRIPVHSAEEMICSAKVYTAEKLYEMGVVDVLCDEGEGDSAAVQLIAKRHRQNDGITTMRQLSGRFAPVDREEMLTIANEWVNAAMALTDKDRRIIDLLMQKSDLQTLQSLLDTR